MKQVFPNIRPRRLGTRGNSRYCYAAMRKATKLEGPTLPDLHESSICGRLEQNYDDESWSTVKIWAENLLTSNFESMDELADFISKQHLNVPGNLSSRQLLQKKLLQRELKEKKKLNVSFIFIHLLIYFFTFFLLNKCNCAV